MEGMQNYIGTKFIKARPMTRGAYNHYRGWELPADENGDDLGFLVEYLDGGQSNHPDHEGYISWSPEDVFEKSYRPVDGMSFGLAIEALKMGRRVARSGWNGKNMFLFLLPAGKIPVSAIHDPALKQVIMDQLSDGGKALMPENPTFDALGSIRMWTADKKVLTGWLASQTDMLSDDWLIL